MNPQRWLGLCSALLAPAVCLAATTPQGPEVSSSLRLVSRRLSPDTPGYCNAVYLQQTGAYLRSADRVSTNNGRTWVSEPMRPDFASGLPHGYRREPTTSVLDPRTGRLITIINAMDTAGLDPNAIEPPVAQETYYLRYRVSADSGKSWLFDEPIVQAGSFTTKHPFEGVWIGKNAIYLGDLGCLPIVTRAGKSSRPGTDHAAWAGRQAMEPQRRPHLHRCPRADWDLDQRPAPLVARVPTGGWRPEAHDPRHD